MGAWNSTVIPGLYRGQYGPELFFQTGTFKGLADPGSSSAAWTNPFVFSRLATPSAAGKLRGRPCYFPGDQVELIVEFRSITTGLGKTGLAPTVRCLKPDGTELVIPSNVMSEVNIFATPGMYRLIVPENLFGSVYGLYAWIASSVDTDAGKVGPSVFEWIASASVSTATFGQYPDRAIIKRSTELSDTAGGLSASLSITVVSEYACRFSEQTFELREYLKRLEPGYDASRLKSCIGTYDASIREGDIVVMADGRKWRIIRISPKRRANGPFLFQTMIMEEAD